MILKRQRCWYDGDVDDLDDDGDCQMSEVCGVLLENPIAWTKKKIEMVRKKENKMKNRLTQVNIQKS